MTTEKHGQIKLQILHYIVQKTSKDQLLTSSFVGGGQQRSRGLPVFYKGEEQCDLGPGTVTATVKAWQEP